MKLYFMRVCNLSMQKMKMLSFSTKIILRLSSVVFQYAETIFSQGPKTRETEMDE